MGVMSAPRLRSFVLLIALSSVVGACTNSPFSKNQAVLDGVGRIPGVGGSGEATIVEGVRASLSSLQGPVLGTIATGNKILVIGDSILAGTASRYGGSLCKELVPNGWRVAVEAEAGQQVTFGRTVLRDRIYESWDAAVVFLGTNYGGSAEKYQRDLTAIVESLAPRPTLLLTASSFRESMNEVNTVIRAVTASHSNVSLLDWGATSAQAGLLNKDGIHPNESGFGVLVQSISAAVGVAPKSPGACLPSKYTDDTMGREFMPSTTVAATSSDIPSALTPASSSSVAPTVSATTVPSVASSTTSQSTTTVAR